MFLRFRKRISGPDLYDLSDSDLVLRYRESHDHEVIDVLFTRYTHLVYGVCLKYFDDREEAKDAVMEVFEGLPGILSRQQVTHFKSWLHTVTRNHCLMKLRSRKPYRKANEAFAEDFGGNFMEFPTSEHPEEELPGYAPGELEVAMGSLKDHQRQCLELVYLQGRSYEEVCELTGYTYKEVKSYIQNGKRNLKMKLEEMHGNRS